VTLAGGVVTATTRDAAGNTSEFSHVLTVTDTGATNVYVKRDADNLHSDVWVNSGTPGQGAPTRQYLLAQTTPYVFGGSGANDSLTVNLASGNPLPAAGMYFDGAGGTNNVVSFIGSTAADTINAAGAALSLSGGPVGNTFSNAPMGVLGEQVLQFVGGSGGSDALNLTAGTLTIDANTASGTANVAVTVAAGAAATFTTDQRLAGLTLNGGVASVVSAVRRTLTSGPLSISGTAGRLDLGRADLITTSPAATIRGYLINAYTSNADWSGATGINSSLAVGNPVTYTLGYAAGNDPLAPDLGLPIVPGQVLVRPTLSGDANLDRTVNFDDVAELFSGKYNTGASASYIDGDLDYNGVVNFDDVSVIFSGNYNTGGTFPSQDAGAASAAAVVQPKQETMATRRRHRPTRVHRRANAHRL